MLCSLKCQLEDMRREIEKLNGRLQSMSTTQKKLNQENISLRESLKQKERKNERSLQEAVSHCDQLKVQCNELHEALAAEQSTSAEIAAEMEGLKKMNSNIKQELFRVQQRAAGMQTELDEANEKVEISSQHVHSIQKELQEKEMANNKMHETLQKFIEEQQETLEMNEELKRELSMQEQGQKAAKQKQERLRKQSTSLQHQNKQKEKELTDIIRQLHESQETVTGLQMDKESLSEHLKRIQQDVGTYQVRLKEMEQSLIKHEEELTAERQSHTNIVGLFSVYSHVRVLMKIIR